MSNGLFTSFFNKPTPTNYYSVCNHIVIIMKQFCRICLAFDVRMHKLADTEKRRFIERIFRQHGYYRVLHQYHYVCYICEALLTKTYSFISRVLRAQRVLENFMTNSDDTISSVKVLTAVDRWKYELNYTNLSFKRLNIGSIDESEAMPAIKEEIDADDSDPINCNYNYKPNDALNVDNDNIKQRNMFTGYEKNVNIKEIEIKLGEPCIDIAVIHNKKLLNVINQENNPLEIKTEENNPLDIMTDENNPLHIMTYENNSLDTMTEETNPLDIMTDENNPLDIITGETNPLDIIIEENNPLDIMSEEVVNNPLDIMTEGNPSPDSGLFNPLDIMTEGHNSLDIMLEKTEKVNNNETDNLSASQCNDTNVELYSDNVSFIPETSLKDSSDGHKYNNKSLHDNTIKLATRAADIVIILDSDSDVEKTEQKKVTKQENKSNIEKPDMMDWKAHERIKMKKRKKANQANRLRKESGKKPQPKNKPVIQEKIEDIIIEGKRKRKPTRIINNYSDLSDIEVNVKKTENKKSKRGYKEKVSDDDYAPESNESSDTEGEREYPMTCEQCDAVISTGREHFAHYLESHPKIKYPYASTRVVCVCEICGARYYRVPHLQMHLLTHGEKTQQCQQCPKKFHTSNQLTTHVTRVHGPKKFVCDYCDKRFPDKANLKLHIRTHTGQKPYRCHICNAGFAHNGNRLLHIRVKHQNLPYPMQEKLNQKRMNQEKKRKRRKQRKKHESQETSDEEPLINKKQKNTSNEESLVTKKHKTTLDEELSVTKKRKKNSDKEPLVKNRKKIKNKTKKKTNTQTE